MSILWKYMGRNHKKMPLVVLGMILGTLGIAAGAFGGAPSEKLAGDLPRVLEEAGPDELIPVSIILEDQLTGPRLRARAAGVTDPDQRRRVLVDSLKSHASRTQAKLIQALQAAELQGRVDSIRPLWIGNIVAADLTPEQVRAVAARPEVDHVNWAPKVDVFLERSSDEIGLGGSLPFSPGAGPFQDGPGIAEIECGVDLMQAPRVWNELGNTGDGTVIALIDSGVCWYHPDIENQIWVNPGEDLDGDGVVMDADDENGIDDDGNGYVDDLIGYDIDNNDNDPNDDNSHGSHTAGTIAGDGTSGSQTGMAPDTRIMVLRVGLTFADEPDVWEAMQYAADNGADSISMSLGWPHNQNPDRATWRQNCENTIDLGTAMVIAAGNEGAGSEPDNIRTPGDVPRVITVAATDCSDNIASFSSRGPVTWQDVPPYNDWPFPPGLTKPDVSGPGVNTKSDALCSGYSTKSGTSMATPHVAGAVALMKSANPGLLHDDLKQILEDTSIDLGDVGKDNVYGTGRVDAYEAVLASQTSDGRMNIREREVRCSGGTFNLVVSDQDLKSTGTLNVEIESTTETTPETVTLTETSGSSGVFKGTIDTAEGPPSPDGVLQVANADLVTATYIDADDGNGGVNVPKTDTATTDCASPVIGNVRSDSITDVSAVIRWDTDEPGDSRVKYGDLKPPAQDASAPGIVTSHAVTLTGLSSCTIYYYQVASADEFGNDAVDDNAGEYYFFETWGDFGNGLQPCHAGQVTLDRSIASCSDTLGIQVVDLDLNLDSGSADTTTVEMSSTSETAVETVLLTETGPNTSVFAGAIDTGTLPAAEGDGVLQSADGDVLTATYHDADNGTGSAGVSYATATADCAGTGIVSIKVVGFTDESAQVQVTTAEATTVDVDWGETAALGSRVSDTNLSTVHTLDVGLIPECGRFFFTVSTTDAYGNPAFFDASGAPYEANVYEIPGAVFKDGFETDTGWSLDTEWEIDVPQGLGTSPGDPTAAYSGSNVLGDDLNGLGSYPGDYEPGGGTITYATSPAINGSSLTNGELKFRRWLNVGGGAISSIQVKESGNSWVTIWNSDSLLGESDTAWSLQTFDVSPYADGNNQFKVRFKQSAGIQTTANRAGWNVDRFIVRDGSLPEFGACGGCGGPPSFAGADSAVDNDACGGAGVTVSWKEAAAWGTGAGGSYAVYRDTVPGFVPSAGNRVASGITALSYIDAAAPDGQQWYYLVQAENDETCGSGPNNGGMTDNNGAYVAVTTSSSRPVPGEVTPIQVDLVNHVHARVSWSAVPDATGYRIYRSDSPDPATFTLAAETSGLFWEDLNQAGNANNWHYKVVAINSCGNEGP